MVSKLVLIGIGIAAVGLLALPQTFALFAGQHNWYTITSTPTNNYGVPCQKCHGDVYAELAISGPHRTSTACVDCHIVAKTNQGYVLGGNADIHAAALPACLDCHDGSWSGAPDARGIQNASSLEAHVPFVQQANTTSETLLKDANEACVACHTHIAVDINWEKAYKISFNATEQGTTGVHTWSVGNFVAEGRVTTETYGNRSGQTTGMTPEVITISPTPPGYNASAP